MSSCVFAQWFDIPHLWFKGLIRLRNIPQDKSVSQTTQVTATSGSEFGIQPTSLAAWFCAHPNHLLEFQGSVVSRIRRCGISMVRIVGVEPTRFSAHAPQACLSAYSSISAYILPNSTNFRCLGASQIGRLITCRFLPMD